MPEVPTGGEPTSAGTDGIGEDPPRSGLPHGSMLGQGGSITIRTVAGNLPGLAPRAAHPETSGTTRTGVSRIGAGTDGIGRDPPRGGLPH